MIIASKNLHKYLHGIQYPVDVLEERGPRVVLCVNRYDLESLITDGAVIGIGSWNRVKTIRLNHISPKSTEEAEEPTEPTVYEQCSPSSITIRKSSKGDKRWPVRLDRAKLGIIGHSTGIAFTPRTVVMEALPGTKNTIERRVVT